LSFQRIRPFALAACGPDALDTQIAADLSRIRSYIIADGNLAMALEIDSGIYLWAPTGAD
jgi:hypothetical protein